MEILHKLIFILLGIILLINFSNASVNFSKDFDSGSYSSISEITEDSLYNITLLTDPIGWRNWLYFNATNISNKNITFIINNVKEETFWNTSNKSDMVISYDGDNWERINNYSYDGVYEFNFTINFNSNNSAIIAPFYPYPYSRMTSFYNSISSSYAEKSIIGNSTQNRSIYLIKITNLSISDEEKNIIYIISRQHSAESSSNFLIEGIINQLLNSSRDDYSYTLNNFVYYFVPMMNPDGVYLGYSRSDSNGQNMNTHWDDNNNAVVNFVRDNLNTTNNEKTIDLFLDIHGLTGNLDQTFNVGWYESVFNNLSSRYYGKQEVYQDRFNTYSTFIGDSESSMNEGLSRGGALSIVGVKNSLLFEMTTHDNTSTIEGWKYDGLGVINSINSSFYNKIFHLKFNENNGTTAYDSSGNANHGTITGATWQNDGILNTLTNAVDYTINTATGLFTITNTDYLYSWIESSWGYYSYNSNSQVSRITNNSLQAIVTYTNGSQTQFSTLSIAIIMLILITVFLVFWGIFVKTKKSKTDGGNFA